MAKMPKVAEIRLVVNAGARVYNCENVHCEFNSKDGFYCTFNTINITADGKCDHFEKENK